MKAKLKVPRRMSNKEDELVALDFLKTRKIPASSLLVRVRYPQESKKSSQVFVSR
jgi:hypothetical protein